VAHAGIRYCPVMRPYRKVRRSAGSASNHRVNLSSKYLKIRLISRQPLCSYAKIEIRWYCACSCNSAIHHSLLRKRPDPLRSRALFHLNHQSEERRRIMPAPCTKLASNRKIAALRPSPSLPLPLIGFVFSIPNPSKAPVGNWLCFFNPAPPASGWVRFFNSALQIGLEARNRPASKKHRPNWVRFFKSRTLGARSRRLGSFFQPCPTRLRLGSFFQIPSRIGFEARNRHPSTPPFPIGFVFSNHPHQLASKRRMPCRAATTFFICRAVSAYNGYFPCV